MKNNDYFKSRDEDNIFKVRELLLELPSFCGQFFIGVQNQTTPLTRLGYARDLKIFFDFLVTNTQEFYGINVSEFTIDHLNKLTSVHLEMFLDYLTV